jgi:putative membrane protein insertion efficiency factor
MSAAPTGATDRAPRRPVRRAVLAAIGFYSRSISPALPPRCRFYPTCSAYAAEAVQLHGAGRGTWLALRRLVKCAPWHPGGVDLVPGSAAAARAGHTGTAPHGHSSSTSEAPADGAPATGDPTTARAIPPASRRAPMEESSLA